MEIPLLLKLPILPLMSLSTEFLQQFAICAIYVLSDIFVIKNRTHLTQKTKLSKTVKIYKSSDSADILSLRIVNPLCPFNLNLYLQVAADITMNLNFNFYF